ncbi:MAG TPA: bifunctional shikimate kinase/3-dehydroquinate synthase [Gaiellaceae bacterium]|nr:bifunctional shikimate kinase/3-dehydroquinate synthase [Gaiellaceae bacterium]
MPSALGRHLALVGFMGAGKSTLAVEVARRVDRECADADALFERDHGPIADYFERNGEAAFRELEALGAAALLHGGVPQVIALGGGAVTIPAVRELLREYALTVFVDVAVETAWERVRGSDRPLARDEGAFRELYEARRLVYQGCADASATDVDGIVLAAGGVHVEAGSLARLGELVPGEGPVALVADAHVSGIHGPAAQAALGARLAQALELPAGEPAKQLRELERLWRALRLDRGGTIVALGGGCTTDAAGFAAATYLRGIDWVPVPTTLVGQVDAAIGGKTAVDLPEGKNLVGAFHWPARTVIDPELLATLPEAVRLQGRAELVKTALLAGRELDVRGAAAYKTGVCLADPRERGRRAVLNLGHTFAHALEAAAGFELAHGDAVALGLLAALRLSGNDDGLATVERELAPKPVRVDPERAWQAMRRDKKTAEGRLRLVLLPRNGEPDWAVELPEADVRRELERLIA